MKYLYEMQLYQEMNQISILMFLRSGLCMDTLFHKPQLCTNEQVSWQIVISKTPTNKQVTFGQLEQ